ncbi:MAG: aldo/keto reductase [Planctomycetota bacterium]
MQHRNFAALERNVSEIGLGCWQIGGNWGPVADETAMEILRAAGACGVNFLDTADVYGDGRSERLVGDYLRELGDDARHITVATKLGRRGDPADPANVSFEQLAAYTDRSLDNLGVDCIDLSQLHCIDTSLLRDGGCFDALRRLRDDGKIRAFGASVESMEQAAICMEHDDLASLQIIFNLFRQKPIASIFDEAQSRGVALIVRLPLASGLLTGKIRKDTRFTGDDHRHFNANGEAFNVGETFAGLPIDVGVDAADAMRPLLSEACGDSVTMAQASLRWILDHPAVTTVIAGASRVDQVRDNAAASGLAALPNSSHAALREVYETKVRPHIRGPY